MAYKSALNRNRIEFLPVAENDGFVNSAVKFPVIRLCRVLHEEILRSELREMRHLIENSLHTRIFILTMNDQLKQVTGIVEWNPFCPQDVRVNNDPFPQGIIVLPVEREGRYPVR